MLTREQALQKIDDEGYSESWVTVRDWIKDMVRLEPKVLRRVSKQTFGDLREWLSRGGDNVDKTCGCLVGTVALELVRERNSYTVGIDSGVFVKDNDTYSPPSVIADLCLAKPWATEMEDRAAAAGLAAYDLADALRTWSDDWYGTEDHDNDGNDDAVALIKGEIVRQLGLRAKRVKAAKKAVETRKRNARKRVSR